MKQELMMKAHSGKNQLSVLNSEMCNKDEKIKEINKVLEGEQSMSVKLQRILKNKRIYRSQVFKLPSVSKAMKSKVENVMCYAKCIELYFERTKL